MATLNKAHEPDTCARCGVLGHDRRTLWMACGYEMRELGLPLEERRIEGIILEPSGKPRAHAWEGTPMQDPGVLSEEERRERTAAWHLYTLRVCKACRAEWMRAIKAWSYATPDPSIAAANNGETSWFPDDQIPAMLADLERLRVESAAVAQRIDARIAWLRRIVDEADRADRAGATSTPPRCGEVYPGDVLYSEPPTCILTKGHLGYHQCAEHGVSWGRP